MGYSMTAKAGNALRTLFAENPYSNLWEKEGTKFFYEIGQEHADGRMTGSIYKINPVNGTASRVGSFHIRADGHIQSWPHANAAMRNVITNENKVVELFNSGAMFVEVQ